MADLDPITTPDLSRQPRTAGVPVRLAAILAGLLVLLGGTLVSFGTVLLAPLAMWVAAVVQRRRGRMLGRGAGWFVAAGSVVLVGVGFFALGAALAPAGTWHQMRHASDSAATAARREPPPTWVQRIAPGAARQSASVPSSPAIQTAMIVWGGGVAALFMAALYGSIGWAAGMLLGFGAAGRWPGTRAVAPPEP